MASLEAMERDSLKEPSGQECPECGEIMEEVGGEGYSWKCPDCGYNFNGEPLPPD